MLEIIDQSYKMDTHSGLIIYGENLATRIPAHPFYRVNWADYLATDVQLLAQLSDLRDAVHAAEVDGGRKNTTDRDSKRLVVVNTMEQWIVYAVLRAVAANDLSLLDDTGIRLRKNRSYGKADKNSALLPPTNFGLKHGAVSGSVLVKCDSMGRRITYGVQYTTGDTHDESALSEEKHFPGTRNMELHGMEPASKLNVRIRQHGPNGTSPWSNFVCIIVI